MGIEGFACPKNTTYKVRGDSLDEESTFINVKITRCNPLKLPNICKQELEIDNFITDLEVQFVFTNSNFDQKDIHNPVKYLLSNGLTCYIGLILTRG